MQAAFPKLDPECCARWTHFVNQEPVSPRVPIQMGSAVIGTAAKSFLDFLEHTDRDLGWMARQAHNGHIVHLPSDPVPTFANIRQALHAQGTRELVQVEQLPLSDENGRVLGSVPRDLARVLGIHTHSVHLVGWQADECWVQERALSKLEDPGRFDTLVGGTVAFGEDPSATLERETKEEAGLNMCQLEGLTSFGAITLRYPDPDISSWGYLLETVHCFSANIASGIHPINEDGEVAAFHRLGWPELSRALAADRFSLAAMGVLLRVTQ